MRECKHCGKVFDEGHTTRLYCSRECYDVVNRERAKIKCNERIEKACEFCGTTFIKTRYSRKIYCSEQCRKAVLKSEKITNNKKAAYKGKSVVELAVEARKLGMSYGQYVAQMEMQKGVSS